MHDLMDFELAFEKLIGHEGAYTRDFRDRGNWTSGTVGVGELKGTKYGISAMSYPLEDIQNLTLARAAEIYRKDYWNKAGCDALPSAIRFDVFDMAVNSGVRRAIQTLQEACGEEPDGILGPLTIQACSSMNGSRLVARFNAARLEFMAELTSWPAYSRGWAKRIASNLKNA